MRVALFAHRWATRLPTGIDRYARELLAAIVARGEHDVVAVSPSERDQPPGLPAGIDVRHVRGPRQLVHLGWCVARRPRIDHRIGTVDVVHATAPTFPVPTRAPLVYTVHDLMPLLHPEWFDRVHRWGFREALADARDRAAAVIADSADTADAAATIGGIDRERISVIPLGVGPRFVQTVADADVGRVTAALGVAKKSYVVYVGQVNDRKNVAVVIEALARMGARPPELVVAGPDGPGAARVRALVARHGLTDSVRFAGFVPDADLPAVLAGARALVHPSRREGFGLPPLEAMAVGIPVIVANTAALPDAVGDAALVAGADDPDSWAAAIAALDDDDMVAARSARGQAHARQFTWDRTASETVAVYARVAATHAPHG